MRAFWNAFRWILIVISSLLSHPARTESPADNIIEDMRDHCRSLGGRFEYPKCYMPERPSVNEPPQLRSDVIRPHRRLAIFLLNKCMYPINVYLGLDEGSGPRIQGPWRLGPSPSKEPASRGIAQPDGSISYVGPRGHFDLKQHEPVFHLSSRPMLVYGRFPIEGARFHVDGDQAGERWVKRRVMLEGQTRAFLETVVLAVDAPQGENWLGAGNFNELRVGENQLGGITVTFACGWGGPFGRR